MHASRILPCIWDKKADHATSDQGRIENACAWIRALGATRPLGRACIRIQSILWNLTICAALALFFQQSEIAEAKDLFVRKTFHEILTPCHILKQLLSGHADADSEIERRGFMRDIGSQIYRLNRLVDDSVDASLFDQGKVSNPASLPKPL